MTKTVKTPLVALIARLHFRGSVSVQFTNILDKFVEYVFDFSDSVTATIHPHMDRRDASVSVFWNFQG